MAEELPRRFASGSLRKISDTLTSSTTLSSETTRTGSSESLGSSEPAKHVSSSCVGALIRDLGLTETNCFCGLLSLLRGMQLIALTYIIEGLWSAYIGPVMLTLPDFGPRRCEDMLGRVSQCMGIITILGGVAGLSMIKKQHTKGLALFRFFTAVRFLWVTIWMLMVGLPMDIVYLDVPINKVFTIVQWLPGNPVVPMKTIVHPEWPDGKPSVCVDAEEWWIEMATSLANYVKASESRTAAKKMFITDFLLPYLHESYLNYYLDCHTNIQIFWMWRGGMTLMNAYFYICAARFVGVVLHGGDGKLINKNMAKLMDRGGNIREMMTSTIENIYESSDGPMEIDDLLEGMNGFLSLEARQNDQAFMEVIRGNWLDATSPTMKFFGGCIITISKDGWKPINPPNEIDKDADYEVKFLTASRCCILVQIRQSGGKRRYRITDNEDGTLCASIGDFKWTLQRAEMRASVSRGISTRTPARKVLVHSCSMAVAKTSSMFDDDDDDQLVRSSTDLIPSSMIGIHDDADQSAKAVQFAASADEQEWP